MTGEMCTGEDCRQAKGTGKVEVTLNDAHGAHSSNVIFPASAFQNWPLSAQCYSMLVGRVISRLVFKCDL